MGERDNPIEKPKLTAKEIRKLPQAERDRMLAAMAEEAEEEYRTSPELTAFEAFDCEGLLGITRSELDELLEAGLNSGVPIQFSEQWWQQRKSELLAMLPDEPRDRAPVVLDETTIPDPAPDSRGDKAS
jgi:hypothetical protein